MRKKIVTAVNAVGTVLSHDVTQIIPEKFKGPLFKKGHIIREEDIPELLDIGKEKLVIMQLSENEYHEDEAAKILAEHIGGENLKYAGPSEGKITFQSKIEGLLTIESETIHKINSVGEIALTTRHSFVPVKKNEIVAGVRAIPLIISRRKIHKAVEICRKFGAPINVLPYKNKKIGLIITGNEIAKGRIKDKFKPIMKKKIEKYGSILSESVIVEDSTGKIKENILKFKRSGCEVIIITAGMSVDPDDITRKGVKEAGARIISYGAPILPGNMFLLAYLDGVVILGVPACALFYKITAFDLFFPRILADVKIKRSEIIKMGYGGLCNHCSVCRYPLCEFGKC